ncbi:FHA domain-containing protein [Halobacteriovorax sp. HLS]|uniref:FHA domain-containing protein n=1 Tax=Halobacteriovorax sp. HLS TaxID=2234000 RepID=UPI000FDA8DC6|nr:FHA domain-containing protein [Halobacteriovorax sp. HLS]
MKLSVSKNNIPYEDFDLTSELTIAGQGLSFLIGRSSECHVHLDDKMVSREHAVLEFNQNKWKIRQVSEYSPLNINGKTVTESEINSGDMIMIGPFALTCFVTNLSIPAKEEANEEIVEENIAEEAVEGEDVFTETIAVSSEEAIQEDPLDLDNENEDVDDLDPVTNAGGSSQIGEATSFFSGQNDEVEFPEDNDGTESFGEQIDGEADQYSDEYADDGYEDDYGLDDDYEEDDKTQVLQSFASFALELFGEFAPYDKYNIEETEVIIGRDPAKCHIVLNDPEVSSTHAKLKKNNITCILEDLQSGNGTILNGERINQTVLTNSDEFIIGSTTFTFHVGSDFLDKEKDRLMPVEENQSVEVEEVVEVSEDYEGDVEDFEFTEGGTFGETESVGPVPLFSKAALKDPVQRKKLIYGVVGILLAIVFLAPDPATEVSKKNKEKNAKIEAGPKKALSTPEIKLKPEQLEFVDAQYQLAKELIETGKYEQAIFEIDKLKQVIPEYKNSNQLYNVAKTNLARIEELERKRREEIRKKVLLAKVAKLVVKAKEATKERQEALARSLFQEILSLDPENFDVPQLKLELDEWKKEIDRIAVEKAAREAERKRQIKELEPGKTYYTKGDWHRATLKLETFLRLQGMDADLVKEATKMLKESKENLNNVIQPLLGKARSLSEGQDLKGSYETYNKILSFDPTHREALNEMDAIRTTLYTRSRKVFREAIIAESLSLFNEAKEKFQEVQQISPSDSEYYQKATDKLKNYLE